MRKTWLWLVAALLIAGALAAALRGYAIALVGSGYSAEILCGGVFISGREPGEVEADDLSGPGLEPLQFFRKRVDRDGKRVTASYFGLGAQTAVFRDGFGCTRIDTDEAALPKAPAPSPSPPPDLEQLWPDGERVDLAADTAGIDRPALDAAVAAAFAEQDRVRPRGTRALVVVHRGRIVAERYAPGFDQAMPLIGWSMSKAALNALVGLRVKDGKLALSDRALLPEWQELDDQRRDITLDDLLRMSSGLAFNEGYDDPLDDVVEMLFVKGDMARFAASKPLVHPPGTYWDYSSGTSAIVARVLRDSFASEDEYLRYPRQRLFGPLGMRSAVIGTDAAGTLTASSLLYASARDYARLGLLFLQDGVWNGQQILPRDWVVYSRGPSRTLQDGSYGAHLWLRLPESANLGVPPMPEDAFYFLGHDEQIVAIVPSRDLVVVRLGLTHQGGDWDHARDLAPIVQAFSPGPP